SGFADESAFHAPGDRRPLHARSTRRRRKNADFPTRQRSLPAAIAVIASSAACAVRSLLGAGSGDRHGFVTPRTGAVMAPSLAQRFVGISNDRNSRLRGRIGLGERRAVRAPSMKEANDGSQQ